MAKIVRFHTIGGPENLKLEEVPLRAPAEGEVKLRVQAVGLNRAEAGFMRGRYFVLGRLLSPLEGVGAEDLPLDALRERVRRRVR